MTTSAEMIRAIKAIARFIERYKNSRFEAPWNEIERECQIRIHDCAGYKKREEGQPWEYFITTGTFSEILKGMPLRTIKPLLVAEGILLKSKDGKYAKNVSIPRSAGQQRLYHISHKIHEYVDGFSGTHDEAEQYQPLEEQEVVF